MEMQGDVSAVDPTLCYRIIRLISDGQKYVKDKLP